MTAVDLLIWAGALVAVVAAVGLSALIAVIAVREIGIQFATLARHRAVQVQLAAEAKAAEQRAELEAADILERRLALPFAGTTSLGEELTAKGAQLEGRLDHAAGVIRQMQRTNDALSRQLGTLSSRVDALQERAPAVTHTDAPLSPRKEVQR